VGAAGNYDAKSTYPSITTETPARKIVRNRMRYPEPGNGAMRPTMKVSPTLAQAVVNGR